jgi:hypothetical protein
MKSFRDTDSDTRIHFAPKSGAGELVDYEFNAVKIDTRIFKFDRDEANERHEGDYTKERHAWLVPIGKATRSSASSDYSQSR